MKIIPEKSIIEEVASKGFIDKKTYIENLRRFDDVVKGRGSMQKRNTPKSYMKAVEFCTYVQAGSTYTEAYERTFPDRAADKKAKSYSNFSSSASIYAKGSLVQEIMSRVHMASHIMFMPEHYKALTELYTIGMEGDSERNRVEALKAFIAETKKPEEKGGNMVLNVDLGSVMADINSGLKQLSNRALDELNAGTMTVQELAAGGIIEAETK